MYHFIGIKGAGMSGLAQILHKMGYQVQGSDVDKYFFTQVGLDDLKIPVYPFDEKNINKNLTIVKGNSFNEKNNEEVRKAVEIGLKIHTYQEMLGDLTKKIDTVCIAGCHGKTTTTSMLSHLFSNTVGANYLIGDGTGDANRDNKYFILEACEYQRHFLSYHPKYSIITNIELDHVDYFKDLDDVMSAYEEFANLTSKMVIACGDDPNTRKLNVNKPIFYYGIKGNNDIEARNINFHKKGTSFEVFIEDNYYGHYDLPIFGEHLLLNALACIAVCYYERIDSKEVVKTFKTYTGAKRRYSETSINNGDIIIVDDYAHHPTEVKATINTTKQKYPNKKIVAIFQPHTFTRTLEIKDELIKVLKEVDYSYILPIHAARENQEDYADVTSSIILDELSNGEGIMFDESDKLLKWDNTVFLFMSPNDLSTLINSYKEKK